MLSAVLSKYLLQAMMVWVPIEDHAFREKREITEARYSSIADDIADVLSAETFPTEEDRLKIAVTMVSIGAAESHFVASVDSCDTSGDHGKAWGIWQVQGHKAKTCESRKSALVVALGIVKTSLRVCADLPLNDRLSFYTDGKCKKDWQRSAWRFGRALSYVKNHALGET